MPAGAVILRTAPAGSSQERETHSPDGSKGGITESGEQKEKKSGWTPLATILMVNCLMWAVALVASVIVLHRFGQPGRLYPVMAGGTTVSIVALVLALKKR